MKRLLSWLTAFAMLLTFGAAFAEEPEEPTQIVVGSTNEMSGAFFTDMWGNNTADIDVRALLHGYQTVAISRNGTYEVDPTAIAEATLTLNPATGNKTYIFSINPELKYNDGTPITAGDYVFSVLLQAAPEIYELGGIPSAMSQFVGSAAYASGETNVFAGVRLLDETHFSLEISAEYLPYFYELLYVNITPYPAHVLAPGFQVIDDGDGAYLQYVGMEEAQGEVPAEAPALVDVLRESILTPETGYLYFPTVTSGPYQILSFDKDLGVAEFAKNPYYLGNFEGQVPEIERITFRKITNDQILEELQNGTVDIVNKVTSGVTITSCLQAREEGGYNVANYLRAGYGFLALSCELGPTASQNVRQALAYCTDAESYLSAFLETYGLRTYGFYGFGQWMAVQMMEQLNTNLNAYALDTQAAKELLIADGWTWNAEGEAYDEAAGGVRYRKAEDGTLESLTLRWGALSDNPGCQILQEYTLPYMEEAGFEILVDAMSFPEMLSHYYREGERKYNMFYMATNFDFVFDPYYTFHPGAEYQGERNTSGIADEELFRLADELRKTDVGDNVSYGEKWFALQKRFNEVLPTIPLYSNVYYDFYNSEIYNYEPSAFFSWAPAILYATFTAPEETEVLLGEAGEGGEELTEIVD